MISEFGDDSLQVLNKKADLYLTTFFPKKDILGKFKKFYTKKAHLVQVEKKEFKANIPISTLSLIDKACQPYFEEPEPPKPPKPKDKVTFFMDG